MNTRIIHDTAHEAAVSLVAVIVNLIREEEQRDAYDEFYPIVRKALETYATEYDQVMARLYPLTKKRGTNVELEKKLEADR
jgi:hypothetical protein